MKGLYNDGYEGVAVIRCREAFLQTIESFYKRVEFMETPFFPGLDYGQKIFIVVTHDKSFFVQIMGAAFDGLMKNPTELT